MSGVEDYFGRAFRDAEGAVWDVCPGEGFFPGQVVTVKSRFRDPPPPPGERKLRSRMTVDMTEGRFREWLVGKEEVGGEPEAAPSLPPGEARLAHALYVAGCIRRDAPAEDALRVMGDALQEASDAILRNTMPGPSGCLLHDDHRVGVEGGCRSCAAFLEAEETEANDTLPDVGIPMDARSPAGHPFTLRYFMDPETFREGYELFTMCRGVERRVTRARVPLPGETMAVLHDAAGRMVDQWHREYGEDAVSFGKGDGDG